jgi:hypothetical protein
MRHAIAEGCVPSKSRHTCTPPLFRQFCEPTLLQFLGENRDSWVRVQFSLGGDFALIGMEILQFVWKASSIVPRTQAAPDQRFKTGDELFP